MVVIPLTRFVRAVLAGIAAAVTAWAVSDKDTGVPGQRLLKSSFGYTLRVRGKLRMV